MGTMFEITPPFVTEGQEKMERYALRVKSPEPPMPFMIEEPQTCEEFTFHCNHKLASDIYRIAYAGRKHNKDGAVIQTTAKSNKVICEIVLACMQALNEKAQLQEEKKTA